MNYEITSQIKGMLQHIREIGYTILTRQDELTDMEIEEVQIIINTSNITIGRITQREEEED